MNKSDFSKISKEIYKDALSNFGTHIPNIIGKYAKEDNTITNEEMIIAIFIEAVKLNYQMTVNLLQELLEFDD